MASTKYGTNVEIIACKSINTVSVWRGRWWLTSLPDSRLMAVPDDPGKANETALHDACLGLVGESGLLVEVLRKTTRTH